MIVCLAAAAIACGGEEDRAPDMVSVQTASHATSTPKRDFSLTVSPASQSIANVVDNLAPAVSILNPADGAVLAGAVSISISASDNIPVARTEIYLDGALFATADLAVWDTTAATDGLHSISATAYDTSGNAATSSAVTVTVQNGPSTRDFTIEVTPASQSVKGGATALYTVTARTASGA